MNIATLVNYLIGRRQAIVQIAQSPQAVWLGLLLVLSTGLAREYDGEDLLHEPWHLLLPLGASLVTCGMLYGLLWLVCRGWKTSPPSGRVFRSFLALYWMTAPLAWLYAIPVERFLSAADSTRANLWLLGIVALWRVTLMVRVVSVVWPLSVWQSLFVVMLFADTILLTLLYLTPLPVFSIMGGIRLTDSEQVIQSTAFLVGFFGTITWPVWAIGTITAAFHARRPVSSFWWTGDTGARVSKSAWGFAAAALVVGIGVLPFTQPAQQLRRSVERDLRSGNVGAAINTMTRAGRDAFPPHWDPPPRIGYGESIPPLIDVLEALPSAQASPWVVEAYREKFLSRIATFDAGWTYWGRLGAKDFDRHLDVIERQFTSAAEGELFKPELREQLEERHGRTTKQKERIRKLVGDPPDFGKGDES